VDIAFPGSPGPPSFPLALPVNFLIQPQTEAVTQQRGSIPSKHSRTIEQDSSAGLFGAGRLISSGQPSDSASNTSGAALSLAHTEEEADAFAAPSMEDILPPRTCSSCTALFASLSDSWNSWDRGDWREFASNDNRSGRNGLKRAGRSSICWGHLVQRILAEAYGIFRATLQKHCQAADQVPPFPQCTKQPSTDRQGMAEGSSVARRTFPSPTHSLRPTMSPLPPRLPGDEALCWRSREGNKLPACTGVGSMCQVPAVEIAGAVLWLHRGPLPDILSTSAHAASRPTVSQRGVVVVEEVADEGAASSETFKQAATAQPAPPAPGCWRLLADASRLTACCVLPPGHGHQHGEQSRTAGREAHRRVGVLSLIEVAVGSSDMQVRMLRWG